METDRHNKPGLVEPRLVLCGDSTESVDDAVKALIDEWLVPALVEEYIRLHRCSYRATTNSAAATHPTDSRMASLGSARDVAQ
jgi:hypothetical protein